MMMFACCATSTINCQTIEGKSTPFCLDGFTRFFYETTVPKICLIGKEGGLVKSVKDGEIDMTDICGTLSKERGILCEMVVPQGH